MYRRLFACVLAFTVLGSSSAWAEPWSQQLGPAFQQAAADYQVPQELLLTLANLGSAFENRGDEPTIEQGYGVMALRENPLGGSSLADAARLTGLDVQTLKLDPVANIRGAAAVLNDYALQLGIDVSKGLEAWQPVLLRYAGLDAESSQLFVWEVYDRLASGFSITNSSGETFTVNAQPITFDTEAMAPPKQMSIQAAAEPAAPEESYSPDYGPAVWDPAASCNYSSATHGVDTVVVHTTEGSYAGAISWFKNCNASVSSQYVIAQDGRITQCVRENQTAWHASCMNSRSIGLEHEGYASSPSHPTAQYNASGDMVHNICDRWGVPKAHRGSPPGILGHVDVTNCCCGTHTDPGNGWDWTYYINRVTGTTPTPDWAATYRAQSFPSSMVAGSTAIVWVEFNNTGNQTWAHCQTKLGTSNPRDRSSPFCTPGNWACADGSNPGCNRPTDVDQSAVANGQVGRFTFVMTAPATPGTYTEKFQLVREGVTWFGPEMSATITVTAATGNLTGTVRNSANSAAIAGASVTLSGNGSTTTNSSGVYNFNSVNAGSYTVSVSATGFTPASSSVTISAGATATKDFNLTVTDTEAPSTPTNLSATATGTTTVQLNWTASSDNIGVTGYNVRRNGTVLGTTATGTSFSDTGLAANTGYTYEVQAKDAAGNVSGWSNSATAYTRTTQGTVFSDGFNGSISSTNWTQGASAFAYSTTVNHGSVSGAGAAYFGAGEADQMSHLFTRPFAQCKASGWFYDTKGGWKTSVCGYEIRQPLSLRDYDMAAKMYLENEFWNTPDNSKYYFRTVGSGGITHTSYATRNAATDCSGAWVYFETTVNPGGVGASPTGSVVFKVTDGAGSTSTPQNLTNDFFSWGVGRLTLGFGGTTTSKMEGYWDDIVFEATPPNIPSMGTPVAVSSTQLRWVFTPADNNFFGWDVADSTGTIKSPQWRDAGWLDHNTTSWTEGGLTPNTQYSRKARTWNGSLNSYYSALATATTLAPAPAAGSVTASPATGCVNEEIAWTAVGDFGPGKVQYYLYAFDQTATHTWGGGEPVWSGGDLITLPDAGGTWYLHVQAFNAENAASGTFDYAITVNDLAAPTITSNAPVCVGGPLNLTAVAVPGATYNWTGPNGFTSTEQNPTVTNMTTAQAGVYSLTLTVSGCTSPAASVSVDVMDCLPPVEIAAWRSIRTRGETADTVSLDGATASVEPRIGGLQKIEVEFNQDISMRAGMPVVITGRSTVSGVLQDAVNYSSQATVSAAGKVVTIAFEAGALPDATCYTINLDGAVQNVSGGFLNRESTDTDCVVRALVGDVNGSGDVTMGDVIAIRDKAAVREPSASSPLYDLNCGGGDINLGDALLARTKLGGQALCP